METQFCTSETNIFSQLYFSLSFSGGQMVKNLPAMQKTWVRFLCQGVPLQKGLTTQ